MRTVSLGKWRRLQQAAGGGGVFTVLAMDHRGPLRRALGQAPDPDAALAELKEDVVRALAPRASAVLLDPEIGLPHCLRHNALPGATGLIVAQDTGSTGDPQRLSTALVPDWSVTDTARVGAAGAKLLVYYHPEAPDAPEVEALVRTVAAACTIEQLPFYLEPLSYAPDAPGTALPSAVRRRVVIETARRLVPLGVDVLKAEFPVNVAEETNPAIWQAACAELTAACSVPWLLLSGGAPWTVFLEQAAVACRAGASGVMAGRAFWKEAVTTDREARRRFLTCEAVERLERLRGLGETTARPFADLLAPEALHSMLGS